MKGKRLLIADIDACTLEGFQQALDSEWTLARVSSAAEVLSILGAESFDVFAAAWDLPGLEELELFQKVRLRHPGMLRFVITDEANKERILPQAVGTHQFILKPLTPETIKSILERAMALDQWIASSQIRELVARISSFPTIPSLYFEILTALRSPDVSTDQIGAIIAKDMATMTKIFQVLNSAYYALPRKITDPSEAVGLLGFESIKSLVISIKLLSQNDKIKPIYYSIDRLWRHSTRVGRTCKQLTLMETGEQAMAETAYTAGLMHDLGKIVLASEFDSQYHGVQSLARKQKVPLSAVEREIFGASHGEVGAYLLGLWGMPLDLLEAAALHDHPGNHIRKEFTPLTAVHIANVLEQEASSDTNGFVPPQLDMAYLEELGLQDRLEDWREAIATRNFNIKRKAISARKPGPIPTPASETPPAERPAALPVTCRPIRESSADDKNESSVLSHWRQSNPWSLAACGATLLILIAAWSFFPFHSEPVHHPLYETTPSPAPVLLKAENSPIEASIPASEPPTTPNTAAALASDLTVSLSSSPPEEAPQTIMPESTRRPVLDEAFPFKLQGILFGGRPAAIINGRTVRLDDTLSGARVVEIQRTSVTIEYHSQRRTLRVGEEP